MVLRGGGSCLRSSGRPLSSHLPGTGTSSCSSLSSRRSDLFPAGKMIFLPSTLLLDVLYFIQTCHLRLFITSEPLGRGCTLERRKKKANTSTTTKKKNNIQHTHTHTHNFSPLNCTAKTPLRTERPYGAGHKSL